MDIRSYTETYSGDDICFHFLNIALMEKKWTPEYTQLKKKNIINTFEKVPVYSFLFAFDWFLINEINPSAKILWFSSVFLNWLKKTCVQSLSVSKVSDTFYWK